ncbi:phosphopentomutase [Blautia glucerasea]|uniref:phosphopentomutase n=1 Tax=Blautia glucerasea TaxID=536633 RepID=UPI001570C8B6|nr:phosphopentomutase [Blautia glucerasea]NSJ28120.1 phosphopentomutase [Blautia glucerasea]
MRKFKRIFLIVIDSLGIGAMKDAAEYGDAGADTLGHIDRTVKELKLPAMEKLGLGNLCTLSHVAPSDHPLGYYARLNEASLGKDTMTGHWEMMGLHITTPFKTFTEHGFPPELIHELEERTGHKIVGNRSESGTKILDDLGEHQIRTGDMIVYTSADSVLQIAGHEETFGLDELYRCCEIAREITMKDEWKVGRVIARPYVGRKKGEFKRTPNRHDYAVSPFGKTALDILKDAGYDVISVGKIADIFNNQGITEKYHSDSSVQGMEQTIEIAKRDFHGLTFVNLVDFDALWGHRRNPEGYGRELEKFDEKLTQLLPLIREDDLLMITADHGNDPTYTGTDHTREQTPLLIYSPGLKGGQLPVQDTFAVSGATILDNFGLSPAEGMIGHTLGGLLA